ncbi:MULTISPECIES: rhodanese-like domain-containing protein [Streptomyces]|uniref:Sulfurtransferase n=1 Tax=Streptomyces cacaoi TaxID=1898 RepID=A0A4Y3QZT0_STRCI|nr:MULTISPECIES: rhodanese-like domain-containing protein [Streptomyces]NNG84995.1 rhodanese-like domain-containing protein [Streptomyces cacaoi]QHF92595.1 rhodanese-like domain-containing protein [Streptomyces sp. NHF165]GEB50702.1 sulfurtransferase [Streptomyces cacaoi]
MSAPGQLPQTDITSLPADALLLDVREQDEWDAGHAEGALHIPMSEFVGRLGELTERLDDGERVYVVCRVGGRSAQVAAYLLQQGIDAVNVDGGMLAWEQAGKPLVGDSEPAFVR